MTLSLILAGKGGDTITIGPDQTLKTTAELLSRKRIGAVLVTDSARHLLGIISERDIVRAVADHDGAVLAEPVSNHMTREITTATGDMSVAQAMETMTKGRFRHLPVLDGSALQGVVSIGDLVKHRVSEMEHDNKAMLDYIGAA